MVSLKMAYHAMNMRRMVEVYDNGGVFVAAIYADEESNGIKIVSKHIETVDHTDGSRSIPPVPGVDVKFRRS